MIRARDTPRIHAHRGDSSFRPENTMAVFRSASDLGVDALEFDVHMTQDGHLVVLHDYDLSRTTTGTGLVHERRLAYVRSLSAGSWFGPEYADERVPLVEEVLALAGVGFEMEVKGVPSKGLVQAISALVREMEVLDRITFTGFHWAALMALRSELPGARLGLFPRDHQPWMSGSLYAEVVTAMALTGGYQVIHLPHRLVHMIDVDRLHRTGLQLHADETDGTLSEALDFGVDGLTTDEPREALQVRRAWLKRSGA
jgi:glycerophosphoryl diester phosphodiesterase